MNLHLASVSVPALLNPAVGTTLAVDSSPFLGSNTHVLPSPRKRHVVKQACTQCQRRKVKCDAEQPCNQCVRRAHSTSTGSNSRRGRIASPATPNCATCDIVCEYGTSKKRGPKPSGVASVDTTSNDLSRNSIVDSLSFPRAHKPVRQEQQQPMDTSVASCPSTGAILAVSGVTPVAVTHERGFSPNDYGTPIATTAGPFSLSPSASTSPFASSSLAARPAESFRPSAHLSRSVPVSLQAGNVLEDVPLPYPSSVAFDAAVANLSAQSVSKVPSTTNSFWSLAMALRNSAPDTSNTPTCFVPMGAGVDRNVSPVSADSSNMIVNGGAHMPAPAGSVPITAATAVSIFPVPVSLNITVSPPAAAIRPNSSAAAALSPTSPFFSDICAALADGDHLPPATGGEGEAEVGGGAASSSVGDSFPLSLAVAAPAAAACCAVSDQLPPVPAPCDTLSDSAAVASASAFPRALRAAAANCKAQSPAVADLRVEAPRRLVMAGKGVLSAGEMVDSSPLWSAQNVRALRQRFQADGYLLLRGFLDPAVVLCSRAHIIGCLKDLFLDPNYDDMSAVALHDDSDDASLEFSPHPQLLARQDIARAPAVLQTLEHPRFFEFFAHFFFDDTSGRECIAASDVVCPVHSRSLSVSTHAGTVRPCPAVTPLAEGGSSSSSSCDSRSLVSPPSSSVHASSPPRAPSTFPSSSLFRPSPSPESSVSSSLATSSAYHDLILTAPFKWLRSVPNGQFTGLHTDRMYMGQGSQRLVTVWTPLGDVPIEHGALLVARGSHRLPDFAALQRAYLSSTRLGRDGTHSGWLSDDGRDLAAFAIAAAAATTPTLSDSSTASAFSVASGAADGAKAIARTDRDPPASAAGVSAHASAAHPAPIVDWVTTDFRSGDVCLVALDTFHMTAANTTSAPSHYRISCDTRWQPRCDPVDPRIAKPVLLP